MAKPVFVVDLKKAQPLENAEGLLTGHGMNVAHEYAKKWMGGIRAFDIEREFPELEGLFYDIRYDVDLAREHAIPLK